MRTSKEIALPLKPDKLLASPHPQTPAVFPLVRFSMTRAYMSLV
jgi:hypothetical protein